MRLIFAYNLIFCIHLICQNYVTYRDFKTYGVQVKQDTAWVSEYNNYRYFTALKSRQYLLKDTLKKPSLFGNENYRLEPKDYGYLLYFCNGLKNKPIKLTNEVHGYDDKKMLLFEKTALLYKLRDSLSGPDSTLNVDLHKSLFPNPDGSLQLSEFTDTVTYLFDSLALMIQSMKNPNIDTLHYKINSLTLLSEKEIEHMLHTANYQFFYGKKLLYELSKSRPQLLIDYVAKNPTHKKKVLKAIRWHPQAQEICEHIEATKVSSKAQRQIKRQYRVHKLAKVGFAAAYIGLIAAEISAIVALVAVLT